MKDIFSSLKPFRFLLLFTFIIQLFVSASGGLMFPVVSNAVQAVVITGRMAFIILFSSFFIRITPVTDIVRLFYHLFMPLKVFGIKPSEPALAMMIALRFIPLLFTEGEKIIDSRKLKNAAHMEENSKNIINSMKSSISLIIPLFARAFYYASQISVTLQYRRHDREFFKLESFKIRDAVSWICFPTVSALIILAGRYDFILW